MGSPEVQDLEAAQAEHARCETATTQALVRLREAVEIIADPALRARFIGELLQLNIALMEERGAALRASNGKSDLTAINAVTAVAGLHDRIRALLQGEAVPTQAGQAQDGGKTS